MNFALNLTKGGINLNLAGLIPAGVAECGIFQLKGICIRTMECTGSYLVSNEKGAIGESATLFLNNKSASLKMDA